ncbi:MAG: cytoskeleton protein RodZ [Myxococcota bacterium]|jgi:cytoskeleton protein RodZ
MAEPIGHIMKAAREDCGFSASDLAKITRIPSSSIVALEEGRFEALPASVFVRGFIRSYCREVDVDPTELLAQYDEHLHEAQLRDENNEDEPAGLGPLLFVGGADGMPRRSHRGLQISHVLLVALALVTFIIAYVTAGVPTNKTADTAAQQAPAPATQTAAQTNPNTTNPAIPNQPPQ